MAKLNFTLPAPIDSAVAFSKIKKLLSGDNDFKKFDPKVACTFDEASKTCHVKGSQFTGTLKVKPVNGEKASQIEIDLELPMTIALFKSKIQEALEKNLKKILS